MNILRAIKALVLALVGGAAVVLLASAALDRAGASPDQAQAAPAQGGQARVQVIDFDFKEKTTTVPVGGTVTFANTGARPHTATDRGGTFDTQPIAPGAEAEVTLTVPGTYFIFCRINPIKMNAVLEVKPAATPAKVVRVQGIDGTNIEGEQLRFDTPSLSVPAGTTLLFANVGGKPHTLTSDAAGAFDTGVVTPGPEGGRFAGQNATITLNTPGTFPFHCEIHPQAMKGTLTVTGQAQGAPPTPASTGPTEATVDAFDFGFKDAQTSVAPNATITVKNTGKAPHTLTLDDVELDTGTVEAGQSATITAPAKPGSYSYKCTLHAARMQGVLVVLGQDVPDPSRSAVTAAPAESAAGTPPAAAPAVAGPPPAQYGGSGAGGGVSALALGTGVLGGLLGGVGLGGFVFARRRVTG